MIHNHRKTWLAGLRSDRLRANDFSSWDYGSRLIASRCPGRHRGSIKHLHNTKKRRKQHHGHRIHRPRKHGFPDGAAPDRGWPQLVVFDTRKEVTDKLVARGATAATSPKDVADQVETVMASLPSLQASLEVATGANGVIEGSCAKRSSISPPSARRWLRRFTTPGESATSCRSTAPVSGGVGGRREGNAGGDGVGSESGSNCSSPRST